MLIVSSMGCSDTSTPKNDLALSKFHARMEEVNTSVSNGMSHSQVVAAIGQPFLCDTNGDSVMALFKFTPPVRQHDVMTNGVQVNFHKGIVVGKSPIQGSRQ